MSGRAAAQLEMMGWRQVLHYLRGKADWMIRGLPMEPRAPLGERLRAFPFFVNNIVPGLRSAWVAATRRETVGALTAADLLRMSASDRVTAAPAPPSLPVWAVVLDRNGVVLGALENRTRQASGQLALDLMNPAPQTIRPDMTRKLAAALLGRSRYLLVTSNRGEYIGRYPCSAPC